MSADETKRIEGASERMREQEGLERRGEERRDEMRLDDERSEIEDGRSEMR